MQLSPALILDGGLAGEPGEVGLGCKRNAPSARDSPNESSFPTFQNVRMGVGSCVLEVG
jgi:hypothetical protein